MSLKPGWTNSERIAESWRRSGSWQVQKSRGWHSLQPAQQRRLKSSTVRNRVLGQPPVPGHGHISARRRPTVTVITLQECQKLDLQEHVNLFQNKLSCEAEIAFD